MYPTSSNNIVISAAERDSVRQTLPEKSECFLGSNPTPIRTGQKHESVTVQTKGDYKTSNVVSRSKAVGDNQHFYRKVVHPAPLSSPVKTSVDNGSPQRVLKMGFFDSEIIQQEAKKLFEDYQSLIQLGNSYGKFDLEGKKMYIEQMESVMERYRIFMKRFELSDDFMAQMTVEQLNTQLGQFGITPQQMFDQMNMTLERMKKDLEKQR